MKSDELNPWMMAKLKGSCYRAKQGDDHHKSIVQQVLQKSTDFLEGQGGIRLSYVCPHCHRTPSRRGMVRAASSGKYSVPGASLRWTTTSR